MKHLTTYIFLFIMLFAASCADDDLLTGSVEVGAETVVDIDFGASGNEKVDIVTRSGQTAVAESRVQDLFVLGFVGEQRIFAQYYDADNMQSSSSLSGTSNVWWRENQSTENGTATHGKIRMKVPQVSSGGATLYLIANVNSDIIGLSPELLNGVRTQSELNALVANLNQETILRNGLFAMTARVDNVTISSNAAITSGGQPVKAMLRRLDAKVTVKLRAAVGNVTTTTSQYLGQEMTQTMKSFTPQSWEVINVPRSTFLTEHGQSVVETGFFNSDTNILTDLEQTTFTYEQSGGGTATVTNGEQHAFTFYMPENTRAAKKSVGSDYHKRDRRLKDDAGAYDTDDGLWEYAPEEATYLVIKGEVMMDVTTGTGAQQLAANATYYIHLGDFASDMDNYDIRRNTHYTYTITIKGVDSIVVEVEKNEERESGATGSVYLAKESILTFDAHYWQCVLPLEVEQVVPERMTWLVSTPFAEGSPKVVNGVQNAAGLDYNWVKFRVNSGSNAERRKNQWYPGDRHYNENATAIADYGQLMDVVQFTEFVKAEKRKYDAGETSAFTEDTDGKYRIYFTVYVDEYYYDYHPLDPSKTPNLLLWKQFVNKPNRVMHILCDSKTSADKASSIIGSVLTLRQRAIQTPYEVEKSSLTSAFGCETEDETASALVKFFHPSETGKEGNITVNGTKIDTKYPLTATTRDNGLYNTACLWGMHSGSVRWDQYVDFSVTDAEAAESAFLRDEARVLRYGAMMRNRDSNGNGVIDPEEVKWYIASQTQIYDLYFGGDGLTADAQTYPPGYATKAESQGRSYRLHIATSTVSSAHHTRPVIVWAEEGVSVSGYGYNEGDNLGPYTMRCVRNLGMAAPTSANIATATENIPTQLIRVIKPTGTVTTSSVYRFDLSNMNKRSVRAYTSGLQDPADEYSASARLYSGFETGALFTPGVTGQLSSVYNNLYSSLLAGINPAPTGYRVPNVREGALMSIYADNASWWNGNIMVSTYYSMGALGSLRHPSPSWAFGLNFATLYKGTTIRQTRAVRDWTPDQ